jgi:hypothetical protein
MKLLLAASIIALTISPSLAADGDMKIGTFGVLFCGAPATFEVKSKYPNSWVFKGKVLIRDTNEYDAIKITQFDDNSLRITRELTGKNFGEKQTVETAPPIFENRSAVFLATKGRGVGCNNAGADTDLRIPL